MPLHQFEQRRQPGSWVHHGSHTTNYRLIDSPKGDRHQKCLGCGCRWLSVPCESRHRYMYAIRPFVVKSPPAVIAPPVRMLLPMTVSPPLSRMGAHTRSSKVTLLPDTDPRCEQDSVPPTVALPLASRSPVDSTTGAFRPWRKVFAAVLSMSRTVPF